MKGKAVSDTGEDRYDVMIGGRRKRRRVRAKTVSMKRITRDEINFGRKLYPETDYWKPKTRADCFTFDRPCPYASCRHHLFLDINPDTGSIKFNFPDLDIWELEETCALDVADRHGITLEKVGEIMNITRERTRQIELCCAEKIRDSGEIEQLREYYG